MEGTYRLYTDGGARGNPGPAAIGYFILDEDGNEVGSNFALIGQATNSVAEYVALIAGLWKAVEMGIRNIRCTSDSEFMVRQLNGDYKVKAKNMKLLFSDVKRIINQHFDSFEIKHARRDTQLMQRADALVNEALDQDRAK